MKLNKEKILQAGRIASEVKKYARTVVKKGIPLIELAEKIEAKIVELGGKPAFPIALSIDDVAAHSTTGHDDKTLASGLIKVDFGVHIDGWIADTSISLDLEGSDSNRKVIEASEKALENAIKLLKSRIESGKKVTNGEIGAEIQKTIESYGLSPVVNLSGHSIEHYNLHSGLNIPNIGKGEQEIEDGLYAIEPFATSGSGRVHDRNSTGIYAVIADGKTRSNLSREILEFVDKEYKGLPFCSRWLVKVFGSKALLGLRELEAAGILHNFHQLVDDKGSKVSQTEHTILIEKGKVIVTTL